MQRHNFAIALGLTALFVAPFTVENASARKPRHVMTADEQGMGSASDVATTRKIRERLVADETLSTYAHNITIVTMDGHVSLSGKVRNQNEGEKVSTIARGIAGETAVKNNLTY